MKTYTPSDDSLSSDFQKFLKMVTSIRETITQLPRGAWVINLEVGYDRDLFLNTKTVTINYPVNFKSVQLALAKFYITEKQAADELQARLDPLNNLIQTSPGNSIKPDSKQTGQALNALKAYKTNMATHETAISIIESALALSLNTTKKELDSYLSGLPAGQQEALAFYQGFESQIKHTVSELKEILMVKIPQIYALGLDALKVAEEV